MSKEPKRASVLLTEGQIDALLGATSSRFASTQLRNARKHLSIAKSSLSTEIAKDPKEHT